MDVLEYIIEHTREQYLDLLRRSAHEINVDAMTQIREHIKLRAIAYEKNVLPYVARLKACAPVWHTVSPQVKAAFLASRPMLCNAQIEELLVEFKKYGHLHDPFFDSVPWRCAGTVQVSINSAGVDMVKLQLMRESRAAPPPAGAAPPPAAAADGDAAAAIAMAGAGVVRALDANAAQARSHHEALASDLSSLREEVATVRREVQSDGSQQAAQAARMGFFLGLTSQVPGGVGSLALGALAPGAGAHASVAGQPAPRLQLLPPAAGVGGSSQSAALPSRLAAPFAVAAPFAGASGAAAEPEEPEDTDASGRKPKKVRVRLLLTAEQERVILEEVATARAELRGRQRLDWTSLSATLNERLNLARVRSQYQDKLRQLERVAPAAAAARSSRGDGDSDDDST